MSLISKSLLLPLTILNMSLAIAVWTYVKDVPDIGESNVALLSVVMAGLIAIFNFGISDGSIMPLSLILTILSGIVYSRTRKTSISTRDSNILIALISFLTIELFVQMIIFM